MSKTRLQQLEDIIEDCQRFIELIPLTVMSKGATWHPSQEAIQLGQIAKDSLNLYREMHYEGPL